MIVELILELLNENNETREKQLRSFGGVGYPTVLWTVGSASMLVAPATAPYFGQWSMRFSDPRSTHFSLARLA